MKIALISPKGPLYRHRGGIFRRSLRYAPLTLTTLASLVPDELDADSSSSTKGSRTSIRDLQADLVGITVITGTAPRAYELAAAFRVAGHHRRARRPARHARARRRAAACRRDRRRLRRRHLAGAAARFRSRDVCSRGTCRQPDLSLAGRPFPRRDLLPKRRFLTNNVFEATRGCIHNCEFCVVPAAWGRKPYQKPVEDVVADIRQHGARKLIFVDLNLIADRDYAERLFEALIPLKVQWYGLSTVLLADDLPLLKLAARSGCRGLLLGLRIDLPDNLRGSSKGFNKPAQFKEVVVAAARARDRGLGLLRLRHGPRHAGRLPARPRGSPSRRGSTCRASPSSRRSRARRSTSGSSAKAAS